MDLDRILPDELTAAGYQTRLASKIHSILNRNHCGFKYFIQHEGLHFPEDDYAQWLADRVDGVWAMPSSIAAERDTVRYQPAGLHDFMPAILDVTGVGRPGDRRGSVPGSPDQMGMLCNWRAFYYGEHVPSTRPRTATQFLVDESTKSSETP